MNNWVERALVLILRSILADCTSGKKALTLRLVCKDSHSSCHAQETNDAICCFKMFDENGAFRVEHGEGDLAQKPASKRPGEFGLVAVKMWQELPSDTKRARLLASDGKRAVAGLRAISFSATKISLLLYLGLRSIIILIASETATLRPTRKEIEEGSERFSILITAIESEKTAQNPAASRYW